MSLKLSYLFGDEEPRDYRDSGIVSGNPHIVPQAGFDWKTMENPNRLSKVFKFRSTESLTGFVGACLEYEQETHHQGRITIQNPVVKIEIWTKGLMDVTMMDIEYAKEINEIYEDWKNA